MWGRGRAEAMCATGPLPASPRWFAASASPAPRSPSSAWFGLLFPRLRRRQLRLRRLLRWPRAHAHVGAIFRLPALARMGEGACAQCSARRRGLRSGIVLDSGTCAVADLQAEGSHRVQRICTQRSRIKIFPGLCVLLCKMSIFILSSPVTIPRKGINSGFFF